MCDHLHVIIRRHLKAWMWMLQYVHVYERVLIVCACVYQCVHACVHAGVWARACMSKYIVLSIQNEKKTTFESLTSAIHGTRPTSATTMISNTSCPRAILISNAELRTMRYSSKGARYLCSPRVYKVVLTCGNWGVHFRGKGCFSNLIKTEQYRLTCSRRL